MKKIGTTAAFSALALAALLACGCANDKADCCDEGSNKATCCDSGKGTAGTGSTNTTTTAQPAKTPAATK